jgi:HlyD family secretion protein
MNNQKSKRRKSKKPYIITAAVVLLALIVFFNLQAQREKTISVTIEKVERRDLTSKISASGEVKPRKNVNISAHIPGRIVEIGVEEGEKVEKDAFLLKLESTQYEADAERDRARIKSLEAEKIKAETSLENDKAVYERQQKLHERELISSEQLEAARTQYRISQAQYESVIFQIQQARASLKATLNNLEKTVYNAPISGVITSLNVEEGEIALVGTMNNPGTVLMTIADLSIMEVDVEVDETDVVNVELGHPAEVRVDAFPDRVIAGEVTEIGSSAIQALSAAEESRDFKVVITLIDPPKNLKPGLSASADIITAEKSNVVAVPISALVLREKEEAEDAGQEEGVFIVQEEEAVFRKVDKGIMGDLDIEIISGLNEGETVIVGPYSALRQLDDGTHVKTEERQENQ